MRRQTSERMEKKRYSHLTDVRPAKNDTSSDEAFSTSSEDDEYSPLHATPQEKRKAKTKQILEKMPKHACSFFLLGATLTVPFVVTICAAQDMLTGTLFATGWVLIMAAAPSSLIKLMFLLSPCLKNISIVSKLLGMFTFMLVGLFLVAFSITDLRIRLLGVGFISVGTGIGELTLLVYAATKFQEVALGAFIAGTATGGVLAALPYVGMTSWGSVNPRTAILIPVIWPSFHLMIFAIMRTKKLCAIKQHSHIRQEIYEFKSESLPVPFWQERLLEVWKSLDHLLLLFLVYFSLYISVGGVLSTLVFSHAKDFGPREDFQHYVLSIILGEFLGRSFMSLLRAKTPGVDYRIPVVCGFIAICFMALFVCASWFRFIFRIWAVFVLCFLQGTTAGIFASNAYHAIANRTLAQHAVFMLIMASLMESCGIMVAGLIGLHTEPALRIHCIESQFFANESDCLARGISTQLWSNGRLGQF